MILDFLVRPAMTEESEEARGALNAARFLASRPSDYEAAEYYVACLGGYSEPGMLKLDRAYNRGVKLVFAAAGKPDEDMRKEAQAILDLLRQGQPNIDPTPDSSAARRV